MTITLYLAGMRAIQVETCSRDEKQSGARIEFFPPIRMSRETDESSIALFQAFCNGKVFQNVVIIFKDQRAWGWTLKAAWLSNYETDRASSRYEPDFEYFTLNYGHIVWNEY